MPVAPPNHEKYAQMGMAALIPGMQHMIELMQAELDRMRTALVAMQGGAAAPAVRKRRGRPRKQAPVKPLPARAARSGPGSYWDRMTPAERQREMARRIAVAKARRAAAA